MSSLDISPFPPPKGLPRILSVSGSIPDRVADGVPGFAADEHEAKFAFDERISSRVLGTLRARCQPDGKYAVGQVRSIYYDTHRWQAVHEKLNSDFLKTKVRLRHYGALPGGEPVGNAFLEAKFKLGSCRRKLRVETDWTAKSVREMDLGGPELMRVPELFLQEVCDYHGEPPGPLLPVFEVTYHRFRFVEPRSGARLSIDTQIRVSRVNHSRLPTPRKLPIGRAVLEVKGEHQALPQSLADLNQLGCKREAFSKFGVCYNWLRYASH